MNQSVIKVRQYLIYPYCRSILLCHIFSKTNYHETSVSFTFFSNCVDNRLKLLNHSDNMPKLPPIKVLQLEDVTENQRLRQVTLRENVWYCEMMSDGQTDFNFFFFFFCGAGLNAFRDCRFWSNGDIYFFSGSYCCSNVVAADAVADVAVAAEPVFVACYHCHLPRSSYKHGASIKAAYPLLYHSFSFNLEWRRMYLFKLVSLDYSIFQVVETVWSIDSTIVVNSTRLGSLRLYRGSLDDRGENRANCFCDFVRLRL